MLNVSGSPSNLIGIVRYLTQVPNCDKKFDLGSAFIPHLDRYFTKKEPTWKILKI